MEVGNGELCDLPSSHRGCRSRTHGAYNGRMLELPLNLNKWLFCRFHSMATEKRVCHEGMIKKAISQKTLMAMFSLHVSIVLFSFNYDTYPKSPRNVGWDATKLLLKFPCSLPHYSYLFNQFENEHKSYLHSK
jgi:hypothetical protein